MKIDPREMQAAQTLAEALPRLNIYQGIHKALRAMMMDTLAALGRLDAGSRSNNRWAWVWHPMVTSGWPATSASAAALSGAAPSGQRSPVITGSVATYTVAGRSDSSSTARTSSAKSAVPSSKVNTTHGPGSAGPQPEYSASAASKLSTRQLSASSAI